MKDPRHACRVAWPTPPTTFEGILRLWEQEGGFAAPDMILDRMSLHELILAWRWGPQPPDSRGGSVDDDRSNIGRVRITIELLAPHA